MSTLTIGDLSQHFQSLRQTGSIKNNLQTLSKEMTTGKKEDLSAHLDGDVGRFLSIDRELGLLSEFKKSAEMAEQTLSMMQLSMETIDTLRSDQVDQSLAVTASSPRPVLISAAEAAGQRLNEMVSILNRRIGDRSLFAGIETNAKAIEDLDVMVADILSVLPASPSVDDILTTVDDWFNSTTSGYATNGYLGAQTAAETPVSKNQSVSFVATAASEGMKSVLKGAMISAVTAEVAASFNNDELAELIKTSGIELMSSASELNALRGQVGTSEALAADALAEQNAQVTALSIVANDLSVADPFDTAVRLQEVQTQLETHFAVTARISNLSLANYL